MSLRLRSKVASNRAYQNTIKMIKNSTIGGAHGGSFQVFRNFVSLSKPQ